MLLNGTAQKLQIITDSAADIEISGDYSEVTSGGAVSGAPFHLASITTATTTDILAGSATGGTTRKVKGVAAHNNHATSSTIVHIVRTDGTNTDEVLHATLLPGESLFYNAEVSPQWTHVDANCGIYGANDLIVTPALGITGTLAESIPREICPEVNTSALTSGQLYMTAIRLTAGQVINNISFFSATTAAGTPTNGIFGLYDSSRNKLAETANFTTEAWAANTIKTKALTAAYTVPVTGLYYVGIMITATTVPTLKGGTARTGAQLAGTAPILNGNSSSGLTTSIPNPAAAITQGTTVVWCAVS